MEIECSVHTSTLRETLRVSAPLPRPYVPTLVTRTLRFSEHSLHKVRWTVACTPKCRSLRSPVFGHKGSAGECYGLAGQSSGLTSTPGTAGLSILASLSRELLEFD